MFCKFFLSKNLVKNKISDENSAPKDDKMPCFDDDNCPPAKKQLRRKKKNLAIKARRLINCVTHYHVIQGGQDRWIPIFDVENFDDVVEFEKYISKVEIDSEELGTQYLCFSSKFLSIFLTSAGEVTN